jgi:hypothetical protein
MNSAVHGHGNSRPAQRDYGGHPQRTPRPCAQRAATFTLRAFDTGFTVTGFPTGPISSSLAAACTYSGHRRRPSKTYAKTR